MDMTQVASVAPGPRVTAAAYFRTQVFSVLAVDQEIGIGVRHFHAMAFVAHPSRVARKAGADPARGLFAMRIHERGRIVRQFHSVALRARRALVTAAATAKIARPV
jgi:hypothetical protein